MPGFLTFDDIKQFRGNLKRSEGAILESASTGIWYKNLFLSHSSKDNEYLPAIIDLLENHGGSVYIDDGDKRLPETPSKETAAILRDTIQQLKKFVLFVTESSKSSKWIPWELGLSDAYKTHYNIALFPAAKYTFEQAWSEQEYLGLYSRIVWGNIKGHEKSCWMVYDHLNNSAVTLSDWIRGY